MAMTDDAAKILALAQAMEAAAPVLAHLAGWETGHTDTPPAIFGAEAAPDGHFSGQPKGTVTICGYSFDYEVISLVGGVPDLLKVRPSTVER